ncbi:MAG: aminotransferase class I/II-fold pyridoxal phosphate-dependent enzyme, partial [Oscillospiraceae bacterium]|nr:aminotransferase class I/II-fold pyridoxal phosphate-dependent enzyme [Oscillospiraceae bacterium]
LLCSPHNPVGRVWSPGELERLGDICLRRGVTVFADEIHQDFIFPGSRHTVFADICPELADITVTGTSPSKTFNIAGLHIANTFIANAALRRKFIEAYNGSGLSQVGALGLVACRAAYRAGAEWLDELVGYIFGNLCFLGDFLRDNLPSVKLVRPEGTYLAWLDFGALGLGTSALNDLIVNKAGLWLDCGTMFGRGGRGFQRINIACPRSVLKTALIRLQSAAGRAGEATGKGNI